MEIDCLQSQIIFKRFIRIIEKLSYCFSLQMAESALAHELVASNGSPSADYYLALGRLKIQQKEFAEAEENLKQAMVLKHQVMLKSSLSLYSSNNDDDDNNNNNNNK